MRLHVARLDDPDAVPLIEALTDLLADRYGDGDDAAPLDPAEFAPPRGLFLLARAEDVAVGCGGWRRDGDVAEVKRMYVDPAWRRLGVARAVLAEIERTAHEAGVRRLHLETGTRQPEALALYSAAGWTPVPGWVPPAGWELTRRLEKALG